MEKLTAIIIARDEELMLGGCLKSLGWMDEIVLVDGGSIDRTIEIAKKYKSKIVKLSRQKVINYSKPRNLGLKKASGEWVFYIDADERVTKELAGEIKAVLKNPKFQHYAIPRKNIVLGKELRYGGQRPDYVKRLFSKRELKGWKGKLHEEPLISGEIGHLKNRLTHEKHETLAEMVEKTNRWSDIEARLMFDAGHPKMNILRFITADRDWETRGSS